MAYPRATGSMFGLYGGHGLVSLSGLRCGRRARRAALSLWRAIELNDVFMRRLNSSLWSGMPRMTRLRAACDPAPPACCFSALAVSPASMVSALRPSDIARRPASLAPRDAGLALVVVLGRDAPREGTCGKLHHSMPSSKPSSAWEILPGRLDGAGPAA